jgi:Carbohydrate binding domain
MFKFCPALFCLWLSSLSFAAEPTLSFSLPADDGSPGPTSLAVTTARPSRLEIRDGHLSSAGQRVRLWGVNICGDAAFPDPQQAAGIAARLAKFGVNAVRLHHLDAAWSSRNIFGTQEAASTRILDPESLARLDRLIAELTARGMWIDLNLLVSRSFSARDGLSSDIEKIAWKQRHLIGFWDQRVLELEKEYASQLLAHVNPYTGLAYRDDPAVGMIELVNENGLLQATFDDAFVHLPEVFLSSLRMRWNGWLSSRYADKATLLSAWGGTAQVLGPDLLTAAGAVHWSGSGQQGARTEFAFENGVAVATVAVAGSAGWMNEVVAAPLRLQNGKRYTVSFEACADQEWTISANISQNHAPWSSMGMIRKLVIGRDWQRYSFLIDAVMDEPDARLLFTDLARQGAVLRLRQVTMCEGGGLDLSALPDRGSLPVYGEGALAAPSAAAKRDWIRFVRELESAFWTDMENHVRGIAREALIVPTIVGVSSPLLMAKHGIIDTHGYWAHPNWHGEWATAWSQEPESMITSTDADPLSQLALKRVAGMPFLVTEYNHCPPNRYAGEGPLMLAAYASLQDWDGVFLFSYCSAAESWTDAKILYQFDIVNQPAVMAAMPWASLVFRRGLVASAQSLVSRSLQEADEIRLLAGVGTSWNSIHLGHMGVEPATALVHRVAMTIGQEAATVGPAAPMASGPLISDTGEIAWLRPGFKVEAPSAAAYVGGDRTVSLAGGGIRFAVTGDHPWFELSVVSMNGGRLLHTGTRALLMVVGGVGNTGMAFSDHGRTVHDQWGSAPTLVEPILGNIQVTGSAEVWRLDAKGQRSGMVLAVSGQGATSWATGTDGTIWYEITWH